MGSQTGTCYDDRRCIRASPVSRVGRCVLENEHREVEPAGQVPYLTAPPGIGGRLREAPEDFEVEEVPLYLPTGHGEHTLFAIEKRGIPTAAAIQRLAGVTGVSASRFSSAGLKDAQAVARQTLSVHGVAPEQLRDLELDGVKVLWAERHRNRLKIGHLAANRFRIRIRGVEREALSRAEATMDELVQCGVPNGFGYQRFGATGQNHELGRLLVTGDVDGFLACYLGEVEGDLASAEARSLFARGDWEAALGAWPRHLAIERRVLQRLISTGRADDAMRALPRGLRRFLISAYQAYLFNCLLAARMPSIGVLERGDLAIKHVNGAFFEVQDPVKEQPRADALEISPSGPLYGPKVRLGRGEPGARERALLADEGIELVRFGSLSPGGRRPFRAPLKDVGVAWDDGVVVRFELPPGSFATSVLREITKTF